MIGKNSLVIGSGGIGLETAKLLYSKGSDVCLTCFGNEETIREKLTIENINIKNIYDTDLCNEESVKETISKILKDKQKLDIVVYCVSAPIINKRISDLNWKDFEDHIDVQIKGLFCVVQSLLPIINNNHKIKFIVLISEACIGKPPAMLSHYITSKYGLMGFVKCLASEFSTKKATFNMVSPGMVNTELLSNMPHKLVEMTEYNNPMKRLAEPIDIANAICFLASDDSDYINGANLVINGGNIFT